LQKEINHHNVPTVSLWRLLQSIQLVQPI